MTSRGDVVLVEFPFTDAKAAKRRPPLVVQRDELNQRLRDTIVVMISGNTSRAHLPDHVLVDPGSPEGASSGLHGPSVVICNHLYTIRQRLIRSRLGRLPDQLMQEVDEALKYALSLS